MQTGDRVAIIATRSGKVALAPRAGNTGDKAVIMAGPGDQAYAISAVGSAAPGDRVVVSTSHLTGERRAWTIGVGSDTIRPIDFVNPDGTITVNGVKCIPIYQNPQAGDTVVLLRSLFGPWIAYKPGAAPCEVRFRPNVTVLRAAQPIAGATAEIDLAAGNGRVAGSQVHALAAPDEVCAFGFLRVLSAGVPVLSSSAEAVAAVTADNYLVARTIEGTLGYGGLDAVYTGVPNVAPIIPAYVWTYLMVECRNLNSGTGTVGVGDMFLVLTRAEAEMAWAEADWRDGRTKWFGEGVLFEAGEYEVYTKGWWCPWGYGGAWNYTGALPTTENYFYPSYASTSTNPLNLVVQEGDVADEISLMSLMDTTTQQQENSEGWGTFILARPAKVGLHLVDNPYSDNRGAAVFSIRKKSG
jgi:hypothetical protein